LQFNPIRKSFAVINIQRSNYTLTLDEKSSKSLSLAILIDEAAARRAKAGEAGEKADEYLSAERANKVIIEEEKGAIVGVVLGEECTKRSEHKEWNVDVGTRNLAEGRCTDVTFWCRAKLELVSRHENKGTISFSYLFFCESPHNEYLRKVSCIPSH
jgi:hypothetical protein